MTAPLTGADAPAPHAPLASLLAASAALAAGAVALLLHPGVLALAVPTPAFLALTHTVTLAYVGLAFAGTLQQLPPVLLVTRLAVPWLGRAALAALALGTAGVVAGFALGYQPLALAGGGALVTAALWATLVQGLLTYAHASRADAAARALLAATGYLALTVTLGFLLAAAPHAPALAALIGYPVQLHLTIGLFGAFLLGIAGAGQRLLAMFVLAKGASPVRIRALTWLVHGAVLSEVLHAFAGLPTAGLASALLFAAGGLQLWEVAALLRVRLRRKLEPSVTRYLWAHAFLMPAAALALAGRQAPAGTALLLGFVVLSVSGMQVKIASFLSWQARYAGRAAAGGGRAPLLRDMLVPGLESVTTAALAAGAALATAAVALHAQPLAAAAAALLALGAWAQLLQTAHIVFGRHVAIAARGAASRPARTEVPARRRDGPLPEEP